MEQRLQKLLASAGVASRRSCEEIIAAGRITVNGVRVTQMGAKADPERDDIRLDGKPLSFQTRRVYIALNKPEGYVTTVRDPHAPHTVMQLVRGVSERIYPVGRLDADSAGLLLLTNDGDFAERMTHPSHQIEKTYRAVVRGEVSEFAAADLRMGIVLEDGMTAPAKVEWVDYDPDHNVTVVDITLHEGRNRQVRRMFDAVGYPVLALTRLRIGPVELSGLAPGTWRKLHAWEVQALMAAADSTPPALPQRPVETEESLDTPPSSMRPARLSNKPAAPLSATKKRGRGVEQPTQGRNKPETGQTGKPAGRKKPAPPKMDSSEIRARARDITRRLRQPDPDEPDTRKPDRKERRADHDSSVRPKKRPQNRHDS
jgi:23S rRNA pseudouridine2605 synthase